MTSSFSCTARITTGKRRERGRRDEGPGKKRDHRREAPQRADWQADLVFLPHFLQFQNMAMESSRRKVSGAHPPRRTPSATNRRLIAVAAFPAPRPGPAQEQQFDGKTVKRIEFIGLIRLTPEAVKAQMSLGRDVVLARSPPGRREAVVDRKIFLRSRRRASSRSRTA
jgi:hypothetical protein